MVGNHEFGAHHRGVAIEVFIEATSTLPGKCGIQYCHWWYGKN